MNASKRLLLQNNGSDSFSEAGRFTTEEGFGPILGTDLTGDGAADVLEGDSDGTIATLLDIGQSSPSPSNLSFGSLTDGQESAPQSVTITNTGAAPTTVEGLALGGATPGAFDLDDAGRALGAGTCTGTSLAPGASCSANVAFREDAATPTSIALGGTGTPPASPPCRCCRPQRSKAFTRRPQRGARAASWRASAGARSRPSARPSPSSSTSRPP